MKPIKSDLDRIDSEIARIVMNKMDLNSDKFKYISSEQKAVFEHMTQEQFNDFVKEMDQLIDMAKKEKVGLDDFKKHIGEVKYFTYDISNIFIEIGDLIVVCNINSVNLPQFSFHFLNRQFGIENESYYFFNYLSLLRNYKKARALF